MKFHWFLNILRSEVFTLSSHQRIFFRQSTLVILHLVRTSLQIQTLWSWCGHQNPDQLLCKREEICYLKPKRHYVKQTLYLAVDIQHQYCFWRAQDSYHLNSIQRINELKNAFCVVRLIWGSQRFLKKKNKYRYVHSTGCKCYLQYDLCKFSTFSTNLVLTPHP